MANPEIGDLFTYRFSSYRVTSWACEAVRPNFDATTIQGRLGAALWDAAHDFGAKRLRWCLKDEATHVIGAGVAGCVALIDEITITGKVEWPAELLADEVAQAVRFAESHQIIS